MIIDGVLSWDNRLTDYAVTAMPRAPNGWRRRRMTDFRRIRTAGYRRVRPADFMEQNHQALTWLRQRLAMVHAGPTVVITHHAPSLRSLQNSP